MKILSLNLISVLSLERMFTADDMRGELVTVFAVVTTDVAFQRIPVSMATHVDGVHDVVQEEHLAMVALEGPQLPTFSSKHPHPFLDGGPLSDFSQQPARGS